MTEDFDSDTCVGFKRRLSDLSEIEGNQQSAEEQHLNSLSVEVQSFEIVSAAEEERETVQNNLVFASESFSDLQKKAKCSSSDEETNIVVQEKQETVDVVMKNDEEDGVVGLSSSQSLNEKEEDLKKYEIGSSGFQDFVEVKKGSISRFSGDYTAIEEKQYVNEVQVDSVAEDCIQVFPSCNIAFDQNDSENFLKNKEKQCLVEPEVESISDAKNHVVKLTDFESSRKIMGDTIKIKEESEHASSFDGKLGIVRSAESDEKGNGCEEMQKILLSVGENLDDTKGIGGAFKCSLQIEVIDETAVIETASASKVRNGCGKEKGLVGFAKHFERKGDKKNVKQEVDGKEKRSQRRGKSGKKVSGTNGKENILTHMAEARNACEKKGDEAKRVYSRKEMEALRFVNVEAQRKKWIEVCCGLGPAVAGEYAGLVECNHQKQIRLNFDPRKQFGKKEESPAIFSAVAAKRRGNHLRIFVH